MSGLQALAGSRGRALGTAREQLQRRRVAGSSFGNAQLTRIESEFAEKENAFRAKAILDEITQTFNIINQEFKVKTQNFQFELDELGIAVDLTQSVMGVLSDQAKIDKQNAVLAIQGRADFFTTAGGEIGGGLEEGITKFFSPPTAAASGATA